jgi:Xaa-Pro dipeptidase
MGYRTCYYRTFNVGKRTGPQRTAYKRAREWMDKAIELLKPRHVERPHRAAPCRGEGHRLRERDGRLRPQLLPRLGLGLHERPLISRVNSLREPIELKAGMVFAVETYCPATDGVSAARIEEESSSRRRRQDHLALPAEELPIANPY